MQGSVRHFTCAGLAGLMLAGCCVYLLLSRADPNKTRSSALSGAEDAACEESDGPCSLQIMQTCACNVVLSSLQLLQTSLLGDGQSVVDSTHTVSTVTATSEQALPPGYRWQLLG